MSLVTSRLGLRLHATLGVLLALACTAPAHAQWINELHYDNEGADVGEAVEVVLPASADPAAFDLYLYNGNGGTVYTGPRNLADDFEEGDTEGGFTVYSTEVVLQNGSPDGLALTENGALVPGQFLSYEGTLTAVGGPANGETSTDIGVAEGASTPVGTSLQLVGMGLGYPAFAWKASAEASFGSVNVGQTLAAPPVTQLQLIHNAPDPGLADLDIYVDGALFEDDLAFRTGTPFFDVPAGTALDVAVAPGDSESAAEALFTQTYTFDGSLTYQLVAIGVGEGDFGPSPDGRDLVFRLLEISDARTTSSVPDVVELNFVNGVTDAPRLDVRTDEAQDVLLFNDVLYGLSRPYQEIAATPRVLEVTDGDFSESFARFDVDLTGREGEAGTLLASGFLTPEDEDDSNGEPPGLGLLFVFADGSEELVEPITVSNESDTAPPAAFALGVPYPNPVLDAARTTVPLRLAEAADVRLAVHDVLGREIAVLHDGPLAAGEHALLFDAAALPSGVYLVRASTGAHRATERFTVVR